MKQTAKQLAEQYGNRRSLPADVVQMIYALRAEEIAALGAKNSISIEDVQSLDRMGRCLVANDLWGKCDVVARKSLLHDEHHFVRSCAFISERDEGKSAVTA